MAGLTSLLRRVLALESKAAEALVELRDLAALIEQASLAAGPRRVRGRVDFERHCVALAAPGRARLIFSAVEHLDRDRMIVGVKIFFHLYSSCDAGFRPAASVCASMAAKPAPLGSNGVKCNRTG